MRGRKLRDAYRTIFEGPNGEIALDDLYQYCRMGQPTYCIGDAYQTAHNEGMRRVFLHIFKLMNMNEQQLAEIERRNKGQQEAFE